MESRDSYCIDYNLKLQKFRINVKNKVNNSKLNKDFTIENQAQSNQDECHRKLKRYKSSNYNEREISILNNTKEKKETNKLDSKNIVSKTKKIINNSNKENGIILDNLPLNYNYSFDSTNDLNQCKDKQSNNKLIQKDNSNQYNAIFIMNRPEIENIDKSYRNKSSNLYKKYRVNHNEYIYSKKQLYDYSYAQKNKNCNIKGKATNIFYSKCNPSKNIIQNYNFQKNNNITYQINSKKKGHGDRDISYNKNIIDDCHNNRRINDNLIKEELNNNYGKCLEEIKYKNEINNLKKKNQELEEKKTEYKSLYEKLQNQFDFFNKNCNDISQRNTELIKQNEELKRKMNQIKEKINQCFQDNKSLVKLNNQVNEELNKVENEKKKLYYIINELEKNSLKGNQGKKLIEENNSLKNKNRQLENNNNYLEMQINDLLNKIQLCSLKKEEKDEIIRELEKSNKELVAKLSNKNKFESNYNNINIINKLNNRIKELEQNIGALKNENNKLKSEINSNKNKVDDMGINIKILKELKEENEKLNKKIKEFKNINNLLNEK